MSDLRSSSKPESQPAKPPPKPVFIDVDGELPPEVMRRSPAPPSRTPTPAQSVDAPATLSDAAQKEEASPESKESPVPLVVKKVKSSKKKKAAPAKTPQEGQQAPH